MDDHQNSEQSSWLESNHSSSSLLESSGRTGTTSLEDTALDLPCQRLLDILWQLVQADHGRQEE
eukprot:8486080-Prorocentrum_lima.AAC.1